MTHSIAGRALLPAVSAVTVAGCLAAFPSVGTAQVAGAPHYPTSLSPINGTYKTRGSMQPIEWNQLLTTGPSVRPNPTYFVICFKAYLPGGLAPSCSPSDATWTVQLSAPPAGFQQNGSRFTFTPPRPLAADEMDRSMRLAVGACAGFACSYASGAVWYSTKNVFADRPLPAASTASEWWFDVHAGNEGSTAIGQYSGQLQYWEVLTELTPGGYSCAWNPDSPNYRYDSTIWTIDERGTLMPIAQLPRMNDRYVGIPIVGMMRLGAPYGQRSFNTGATALPPGEVAFVKVASVALPVADSGRRRAYAVVARHDTTNAIREFDEIDNARAWCFMR